MERVVWRGGMEGAAGREWYGGAVWREWCGASSVERAVYGGGSIAVPTPSPNPNPNPSPRVSDLRLDQRKYSLTDGLELGSVPWLLVAHEDHHVVLTVHLRPNHIDPPAIGQHLAPAEKMKIRSDQIR